MTRSAIQSFGKYQILERIASGGTAEIYKAKLEGIGGFKRMFAIKRILPNLSQHADYIAMLVDEAKVAGLLSHANIVQILDLGEVDNIWYIAMEYVEGRDLGAILRRATRKGLCLPVPHAVFVAIELLKGLEYAHQRQVMRGGKAVPLNIIHRDVSPPNILISFQGEVKLTDFGIARASLKMMETVSGLLKGRFDYMSPEQASGRRDLDQRSDLFSVGVVLYEMLTGVHPFRAESEITTVERVRTGKFVPVATRNPEVPFALQTIIDKALQVDPDQRYSSATEFKEALDQFFHESGFLFTHATLSTYLKGLFPESEKRGGHPDASIPPPDGISAPIMPIDNRDPYTEPPTDVGGPAYGMSIEDLEATAIRSNPLLDDVLTQEEEEIATVIRPGGLAEVQEALAALPEPLASSPISAPEPMRSMPAPPLTAVETRSAYIGWLGMMLSLAFLVIGLGLGSFLAGGGAYLMGVGTTNATHPVVRVLAQSDVEVLLDGNPTKESFALPPHEEHNLEIRADGYGWSIPLKMAPGEVSVYVIQVPKPTEGPGPR